MKKLDLEEIGLFLFLSD